MAGLQPPKPCSALGIPVALLELQKRGKESHFQNFKQKKKKKCFTLSALFFWGIL